MRKNIHPEMKKIVIRCACGAEMQTKSTTTVNELTVEVCSKCHPLYTGKQKLIDTGGRVGRFQRRFGLPATTESTES